MKSIFKHSQSEEDQSLTYEQTHLELSREKIEAVLANPDVTFQDCDALYFSLLNGDATLYHEYSDRVLKVQGDIVTRK